MNNSEQYESLTWRINQLLEYKDKLKDGEFLNFSFTPDEINWTDNKILELDQERLKLQNR